MSGATTPVTIPDSERFVVDTEAGALRVHLAWPAGDPPADGWPVLWVLDPADGFAGAVEAMRFCSRRSDATGIVPAVIVGVEPDVPPDAVRAERERLFIGAQRDLLRDALDGIVRERVYERVRERVGERVPHPCDTSREVIAGHSLGGVFALYAALAHPGRFRAVGAVSSSLWHGTDELLALAARYAASADTLPSAAPLDVLLAVGEYEQGLAPWELGRPESSETLARRTSRRMIDTSRMFASRLAETAPALRVQFRELADADHATARIAALPATLRLLAPSA